MSPTYISKRPSGWLSLQKHLSLYIQKASEALKPPYICQDLIRAQRALGSPEVPRRTKNGSRVGRLNSSLVIFFMKRKTQLKYILILEQNSAEGGLVEEVQGRSFPIQKFMLQIFAIINGTSVMNSRKNMQCDFLKMQGGGGQRPFGIFQKNHPSW